VDWGFLHYPLFCGPCVKKPHCGPVFCWKQKLLNGLVLCSGPVCPLVRAFMICLDFVLSTALSLYF